MPDVRQDPMIGKVVGDYAIERLIAKGGMGRVYEAKDAELQRRVAIKVITLDEEVAEEMMDRFRREAQAISSLDDHTNIVTIYRYGKAEGIHYIAMKYIDGIPLSTRMKNLRQKTQYMPNDELLYIARQVAAALDYAHGRGVIHRDVKPANIMLETHESGDISRPKATLMDFGLVLRVDNTMTTGSAFGTPRYISPEQAISSASACDQSDIYSFGVIIYEILTGKPPFEDDETPIGVALSHVTKPPPSPQELRAELSNAVVDVMMKVLAKKPEERYQTAKQFVDALEKALSNVNTASDSLPYAPAPVTVTPPPIKEDDSTEYTRSDNVNSARMAPAKKKGSRLPVLLAVAVVLIGALIGAALLLGSGGGDDGDTDSDTVEQPIANNDAEIDGDSAPPPLSSTGSLEFFYEESALTIRNPSNNALDLRAVELRQAGQTFALADFGTTVLENWSPGRCGYVMLTATELDEVRPQVCAPVNEVDPRRYIRASNFVWAEGDAFEVYQDGRRLGECPVDAGRCTVEGLRAADG